MTDLTAYGLPAAQGLYDPANEHDACGVGFIANINTLNALLVRDWAGFWDALKHMILPAMALGTIPLSIIARMTRSSLLDILGTDYVRTARAKGLIWRRVITKHALRNALIPIVTIIGIQTGGLLSGAVLTETIFSWPCIGSYIYEGILNRDYPVVQMCVLISSSFFVFANLIVDIVYAYLDPRIRYR